MSIFGFETTGEEVASTCSDAIRDKIILVTGSSANTLAAEFVKTIAIHAPSMIILASRDTSRLQPVAASIKSIAPKIITRLLTLDLASQAKVREAAKEVNAYEDVPHIDVLVNSAGLMAVPYGKTAEGIELQFGTNHIGHFLFTNLITGKLISEDGRTSRVVNVSSNGHELSGLRFEDWNFMDGKHYNRWYAYGQSKTANILFSQALATRLASKGVIAVSLHPGAIASTNLSNHLTQDDWVELAEIGRNLGLRKFHEGFRFKTEQQGVATYVFAAFHDSITNDINGRYFENSQIVDFQDYKCWARDSVEAERLWKLSEMLVGQDFKY